MADLDRSRRRVELNNQRLHWISVLVDLAVFYLFGLAFTLLYPHIATFFPSSGFDLSKLYSLAYDERFYQLFIGPCRLHKDGGLPHAGCIRLIHFRPDPDSSPDSAGHLVVENRVFPITSAPTYRALSYTWGEAFGKPGEHSFTPRSALYGGQPIPSNLASAFDRLARLNLEEDEWSAWYWVDFVSIDQENIRERGEQVGNMHRIYQQAEAVDIWLGPADDSEASQVTEVLRYIVHHADSPGNRCRPRFPNHLIPDREWDILASFFSRRWFHRLWTLQEFALASQVRIMLGDEYIDPALLWRAATFLYNRAIPLPLHYGHNHSAGYAIVQFSILRKCVEDTDQLLRLLPMFATRENRRPDYETVLAWLFWRSAATFATDARDYIYGILGIADTIMEDLAQATECNSNVSRCAPAYTPIKPDYSLDTARVFRDFIIRLMYGSVGIRAMTLIQGRGEIGAFESGRELQRHAQPTWIDHEGKSPSWIPNLAHKNMFPLSSGGGPSVIFNDTEHHVSQSNVSAYDVFGSSSKLSSTQRFHIRDTNLHVFGRRIGVVNHSSHRLPYAEEPLPCLEFAISTLDLLADARPHDSVTEGPDQGPNALESLLSTLAIGSWEAPISARNDSGQSCTRILDARRMESFYAGSLSTWACIDIAQRSKPISLETFMVEWDISRYSKISGLSANFLERRVAKWSAPEMTFKWGNVFECVSHGDLLEEHVESQEICNTLVSQFHWARGRSLSSITLDSQLLKRQHVTGDSHSHQGGDSTLLSLGPGMARRGDEIWALQGSEWPFVLRQRHWEEDGEPTTGNKLGGIRSRWWWPWDDSVGDGSRPAVYELRGDVYVHGLMHGELGTQLSHDLEEIIIS